MATDVASDFSKYLHHDIHNKLSPINRMIEDMLARLEEFETMVNFVTLDVNESTDALSSLTNFNKQLLELFSKIDTVEKVINHLKGNLNMLELDIQKAEQRLKLNNDNKLVTNIITPLLFRKTTEKKNLAIDNAVFDINTYFSNQNFDNESTVCDLD
ncbi:hypothetical protein WA026_012806 [Henosepilachna vigintioctopunctata]